VLITGQLPFIPEVRTPPLAVRTSIGAYDSSASLITSGIRLFTIVLRLTMFKRSKSKASRGEPTTPKLSPAPLPDTDNWAGPPPSQPNAFGKVLKPFFGRLGFDRRAESPHSTSKPCYQSDSEYVSRFRRVPMSKQEDGMVPRSHIIRERH
jgi:hypothetical protein